MAYIIAGLGNPGEEYGGTRHNTGRIIIEQFRLAFDFPDWKEDKKIKALVSKGSLDVTRDKKVDNESVTLIEPNNFMNNSGKSLLPFVKSKKTAEKTIIIYDDIDLPLGVLRISFNRGTGGHKGLESVAKAIKTKEFIRLRVGVSKMTAKGVAKKPSGEEAVLKFLLGAFKKDEMIEIQKIAKRASEALRLIITQGHEKAMGEVNRT